MPGFGGEGIGLMDTISAFVGRQHCDDFPKFLGNIL